MNRQELIGKYEDKLKDVQFKFGENFKTKVYDGLIKDLKQLYQPQKVTVPQFVADWYEENKDDFEGELFRSIDLITRDFEDGDLSEFEEWFIDGKIKPFQTLVNMHQFGYTVEKEKRYRVKMKKVGDISFLNHDLQSDSWLINNGDNGEIFKTHHTRKELEQAGFGWVFDCPGMEVEEVE